MDAAAFWEVIGEYNLNTGVYQIALLVLLIIGVLVSYFTRFKWIAKVVLGVLNLFIAVFFFLKYGTEPIQRYFALPLFAATAVLFFYDAIRNSQGTLSRPKPMSIVFMVLYAAYPAVSVLFGGAFPQMVTHIMPCPVATISIAVYSCYKKKNLLLLILLTLWGLTGVKALIFSAYEDVILLLAGIYGVWLIISDKILKLKTIMNIYNLGNRIVNNYLVSLDEGGYVLIDTGYSDGFEGFTKKLEETGVAPKEIKYVFLTHAHDDHAGFLNDVLAITDAKVILHPMAIDRLHRGQNSFQGGCSSRQAWLFCQILALFGKGEHKYPPIKEAFLSRLISIDSDAFKALALPFEVVKTPGHTADHISMLKDGILFCGDAAMNNFPSIKRTIIWIESLEQYKQSWEKMIALNPKLIYPSHGKPFPTKDLVKYRSHLDGIRLYSL